MLSVTRAIPPCISLLIISSSKRGTVEQVEEVPAAQRFCVFRALAQGVPNRNMLGVLMFAPRRE
jgi:hypothetical protein